jgi:quercetin dioxygenase-like cupin family protein/RES domain-containing protein
MRVWRLTRTGQTALDGAGTLSHGGRYSPPGAPVVNFASEAGLAVLVALRYLPGDPVDAPADYVLGWTEIDAVPERIPDADGEDAIRARVAEWLEERRTLLAAVRSQVLPEADVVLMNPLHPDAARVPPLVTRPFSFAQCLHTPPMLARYADERATGYGAIAADELEWITRPHGAGEPARHVAELSERIGFARTRANLWRYEPGAVGRRHVHAIQEETFLVLAGTLSIYLGEPPERHDVATGGLVRVDPGTPLQSANHGDLDLVVYAHGYPPEDENATLLEAAVGPEASR